MSSQDNFQAALARAKARAEEDVVAITLTFYDEPFTFTFKPRATPDAIEIIGRLTEQTTVMTGKEGDTLDATILDTMLKLVTEFLDAQAAGDTSEQVAALMHSGIVGISELFDLQRAVVEAVAGRPTMSASSSPIGSSEGGKPSTDGALPEPLTPAV